MNPLGLIVTPTGRALCLPPRNGAFDAIKSAAALRLSPCLCVLRCPGYGNAYDFLRSLRGATCGDVAIRSLKRFATELCVPRGIRIATPVCALVRNDLGSCGNAAHSTAPAVRMSPWKQCARHTPRTGLIASIAPMRKRSKASTSPLMSPLTPGDSRGPQPPWRVFLPNLSSNKERLGHRRSSRKENVNKNVKNILHNQT